MKNLILFVTRRDDGLYSITSDMPGLFLCGPDLSMLLADVPRLASILQALNGTA